MEWIKQQKLISSQFWRLEVKDQDVSRVDSPETSLLGLGNSCLLIVPSHALASMCMHPWSWGLSLVRTSVILDWSPILKSSFSIN
jgi:hypothetical protein